MKKILLFAVLQLTLFAALGQKKGLNYQAVILDPNSIEVPGVAVAGQPLSNGKVWVKFTLKNSKGTDYEEIQQTKTDEFGLISLTVGMGTSTITQISSSTSSIKYANFDAIVWDAELKSLVVSVNFDGGSKYTEVSNQKLNYTPYALYAESVDYKNVRDTPKNLSQFNNDAGYLVPKDLDPLKSNIAMNSKAIADNQATNEGKFIVVNQTIEALDKKVKADITNINNTLSDHDNRINSTATNLTNTTNNLSSQIGSVRNLTEATANAVNNLGTTYESAGNKSTATDLGGGNPSDVLFPTQRAAKTYVDNAVSIAVASGAPDATTLASGKIQLTGDLGGTATNPTVPGLTLKENVSNKSTNVNADAGSDSKYPSVRAIKTYVDQATMGIALQATVDAKADKNSPVFTGTPSMPSGTTAVTQSPGNNSTAIATTAFVQGAIASATIVDADATTKGKIQLAGDLGGTAGAPTVPALANKEDLSNKSTATALGTSDQLYPSQRAVKVYVDNQVASATIADADANTKGKIQLAGDLTGTAAAPVIATSAVTSAKIADGTIASTDIADNAITTAKITDANVTYAKIQNVSATDKVLGRISAGAGVVEEISTTGSGNVVRATSPTLVTPAIGAATGTSLSVTGQLTSSVATGTAPLVVTSTTPVANLSIGGNAATATTATNLAGGAAGSIPYQTASGTTAMLPTGTANQVLIADGTGGYSWLTSSSLTGNYVPYTGATGALNLGAYDLTVNGIKVGQGSAAEYTNTAVGQGVLTQVTLGSGNGTGLTAMGYNALRLNTSGFSNTGIGYYSLGATTSGNNNTAIGMRSLMSNTSGSGNFAGGSSPLYSNTTGFSNTAVGNSALYSNTTGNSNVGIGSSALYYLNSGNYNLGLGIDAGKLAGSGAGSNLTTITKGVFVGYNSRAAATSSTNEVVIGADAIGNGNNTVTIGNSSITDNYFTGNINGATWNGTTISVAKGGTGATTAADALTNLGAQSSANLSTNLTTDAASLTKYPAVKTVKDYVDASVLAATPDATTTAKGKIQLGGDLAGTGTTAAAPVISDNAITTVKITDANVTTAKLADNAVTTVKITDANVTTAKIADLNVTTGKLADDAVTTIKITDANVTTAKIAPNAITTAKVADGAITNAKIADATILNAKLGEAVSIANGGTGATTAAAALTALGAQATANLSTNMTTDAASLTKYPAVKTVKDYVDASVVAATPDADATTKGKIQLAGDLTGTAASPAIAASAVTTAKINNDAVTSAKIADGTIVNADINASAAIADTKLATISTSGKVSNSATTATDANTASAIVARDANGDFAAGTITASLTGLASKASNINGGTLGAIPYQSAANTTSLLTGSTSSTKQFLTQTGTGSVSAAPAWGSVVISDVSDLGTGVGGFLGTPTSANLASAVTNETGSGALVFATSPTLVTPTLGVASATSVAFAGSTSGTATLAAPAVAGTTTITLPAASGTLATLAGTETLTNKTLTSPVLTTPDLGVPSAIDLSNASSLPVAAITGTLPITKGGTGATTAAAALTALGAQSTANLSTDVAADAASNSKYPGVKAIKDYVDASITSGAPDADATTKGKVQLAGDLTGTAASPAIAASAVTTAKINNDAVTSAKIADGTIVNADINASAAIADTKLATISTSGKVSNSATTATDANTASAIVARDASGNFVAGTITADLVGTASKATNIAGGAIGAIPYQTGANATALLSGNTSSTKKFLTQTGNNNAATAPVWAGIDVADISGTLPVANGGTGVTTVAANLVFAGPTSGASAAAPSFRSLVAADLPAGSTNYVINGTTQQASTNFNISGAGTIGTDLTVTGNASIGGTATITGATTLSALTASKGVFTDASKRLTSTGTLGTDQGGTGMTSFNSGGALYATSTSALTTGTLPTSAGGTGLTTYTSGGALYTTSTTAITSGTLPLTAGGTGATTKAGAFDALSPMTTAGDLIIGTGTTVTGSRLGIGTTGQVLTVSGGLPAWATIPTASASAAGYLASADWSTFNGKQAAYTNLTTIGSLSNGAGFLKNTGTGTFTYANPAVTEVTGLGTGVATWLATPSSANFASAITDETGTGVVVLATSPTLVTPTLGVASATSVTFAGSTSGTATISAPAVAGTSTAITLPAASGTLATLAGTETLTNKTLTSPVLTTPDLGTPSALTLTSATGLPLTTGTTGTLPLAKGGTGQTTKAAAFDALSPMTTAGDIIYGGTSGTGTRLAKGTDGQVLTLASGVPSWASPAGVTSVGTISLTSNANGATITSGVLNLTPADATNGGVVTNGNQTFAGNKTFSNSLTVNGLRVGRGAASTISSSVALGSNALSNGSTTGTDNIGIGSNVLASVTSGASNIGIGTSALNLVTTGSSNIALGSFALTSQTTGDYNVALGKQTLTNSTTGSSNVAVGDQAGVRVTTGINNTIIGASAGIYITSGTHNVIIGTNSGNGSNTTGTNSVFIGRNTTPAADNETNEVVIAGYNGSSNNTGLGSNTTLIGNSATTFTAIAGDLGLGSTTDGGAYKLQVTGDTKLTGTLTITGGAPGAGKVLVSDANGLASWSNGLGSAVTTSTAAYSITLAESIVFYTGTAAGTFSIPAAASTNLGKQIIIKNKTGFGITITPASGSIYIDNANSAAANVSIGIEASNNWIKLVSDGTQWNVLRALF